MSAPAFDPRMAWQLLYPDDAAVNEEAAAAEQQRQARIAAGEEHVCSVCGCSESQACEGGCLWATETLCSRCV